MFTMSVKNQTIEPKCAPKIEPKCVHFEYKSTYMYLSKGSVKKKMTVGKFKNTAA